MAANKPEKPLGDWDHAVCYAYTLLHPDKAPSAEMRDYALIRLLEYLFGWSVSAPALPALLGELVFNPSSLFLVGHEVDIGPLPVSLGKPAKVRLRLEAMDGMAVRLTFILPEAGFLQPERQLDVEVVTFPTPETGRARGVAVSSWRYNPAANAMVADLVKHLMLSRVK